MLIESLKRQSGPRGPLGASQGVVHLEYKPLLLPVPSEANLEGIVAVRRVAAPECLRMVSAPRGLASEFLEDWEAGKRRFLQRLKEAAQGA